MDTSDEEDFSLILLHGCAGDYLSIMACINIYSFDVSDYGTNDNNNM